MDPLLLIGYHLLLIGYHLSALIALCCSLAIPRDSSYALIRDD